MHAFRIGSCVFVAALVAGGLATAEQPPAAQAPPQQTTSPSMATKDMVLKDIEKTFGFVPQFFREIPAAMLPGFWETMKFQLSKTTKLDGKTKELIGLAVSSQIPCEYCVVFHTEAAKLNGATEEEIEEAVGMAAVTRMGSTLLNGLQIDRAQFKRDVDRLMRGARSQARK